MLGKVARDRDKPHFLPQWMKCHALLDKFLSDCGTKTISSEQTFCRILKPAAKPIRDAIVEISRYTPLPTQPPPLP